MFCPFIKQLEMSRLANTFTESWLMCAVLISSFYLIKKTWRQTVAFVIITRMAVTSGFLSSCEARCSEWRITNRRDVMKDCRNTGTSGGCFRSPNMSKSSHNLPETWCISIVTVPLVQIYGSNLFTIELKYLPRIWNAGAVNDKQNYFVFSWNKW